MYGSVLVLEVCMSLEDSLSNPLRETLVVFGDTNGIVPWDGDNIVPFLLQFAG